MDITMCAHAAELAAGQKPFLGKEHFEETLALGATPPSYSFYFPFFCILALFLSTRANLLLVF
jgi:hypothetical protein